MPENNIVGRFAPTPSGQMHLGNVFAALLAWLSVRAQKGRILLRMEDLDSLRTSPAYGKDIMDDLLWLGLDWDEPEACVLGNGAACKEHMMGLAGKALASGWYPQNTNDNKVLKNKLPDIYLQSGRTSFYEACLEELQKKGLVYPCFCSRAQLHTAEAPHLGDGTYVYDGKCRRLAPGQIAKKMAQRKAALRIEAPGETIGFTDGCQGYFEENLAKDCGDFILRRSDGVFAYQLATPADDGAMDVTEVVRGRDLLSSTPRQIWLMGLLGYGAPKYYHLPLLLAPDGRRLAKRDKDLDLGELRERFRAPEGILGALAHLAGLIEKPAPVTARELVSVFSWEKVRREDIVLPGNLDEIFTF